MNSWNYKTNYADFDYNQKNSIFNTWINGYPGIETAPATCGHCTDFSELLLALKFNSTKFLLKMIKFENTDQT